MLSTDARGRVLSRAGMGSPHTDFGEGFQSGDLVDPLYFELAINSTVALLDFFSKYGKPIKFINLDYDEVRIPLIR